MPTVTTTEIVADVLDALKVRNPFIFRIAHQFTNKVLKRGNTAIAHISKVPNVNDHDDNAGYGANAADAKSLYEDVPITIDQHKDVDLSVRYINSIVDNKMLYKEAIDNAAYALGRAIVQHVLALAVAANFSEETQEDALNYDKDTLGSVRKKMNVKGAPANRRIGIVNSDAFEALDSDPRITSNDHHGQRVEGNPLGVLTNVAGFSEVFEYPEMPDNAEDLNGLFLDPNAIALMTGIPDDIQEVADELGIPNIAAWETVTEPESGLTLLCIKWMKPGTFDLMISLTVTFGAVAGKQGGAAGEKTDFHAHRVVEAP